MIIREQEKLLMQRYNKNECIRNKRLTTGAEYECSRRHNDGTRERSSENNDVW